MDGNPHVIRLSIPIYDSLLCLSYSLVRIRLEDSFPSIQSVEEWTEIGEYKRLQEFIRSRDFETKKGEIMLGQLRAKQLSHGPSFRLRMDASDGEPMINVSHNRWGITFQRSVPFSKIDETTIHSFLTSIGVGTIKSQTLE